MQAIRLHPNSDPSKPYSTENPAPPSALVLDSDLPIPQPLGPGEISIRVETTTVIRDELTWPETYLQEYTVPGHDFAGTVVAVNEASTDGAPKFKPGDEVYGMTDASRGATWAEYAIVFDTEACLKPQGLSWAQAAAVPLSGLTAYQALFDKAGFPQPDLNNPSHAQSVSDNNTVLITGASGCVGLYMIQLAKLAGLYVVAATRSNARNKDILSRLGADEIVEYDGLSKNPERFQTVIDTVGGQVLRMCWTLVSKNGTIISIDSASFDFVEEHRKEGISSGCENVKALFFIVEVRKEHLDQLSAALEAKLFEPFVAEVVPLKDAAEAYARPSNTSGARGVAVERGHGDIEKLIDLNSFGHFRCLARLSYTESILQKVTLNAGWLKENKCRELEKPKKFRRSRG